MLSKSSLNCLVFLSLTCSLIAVGQETAPAGAGVEPADVYGTPPEPQPRTFNIEFRGGDLRALFRTIKEQNEGAMPNVVISDDVKGTEVPPFRLVNIAFFELMEALGTIDIGLDIDTPTENVSTISKKYTRAPSLVEIYSLRRLLDPEGPLHFEMDDIATAIQTAWEMMRDQGEPYMKVHQETGLLIVQGSEEEQEVVKTVISRLLEQWEEAEHALSAQYGKEEDQMREAHQEQLKKLKDTHAQELTQTQRLFEMELKGHEDEVRSLRDRYEKLLAEYEAFKREN